MNVECTRPIDQELVSLLHMRRAHVGCVLTGRHHFSAPNDVMASIFKSMVVMTSVSHSLLHRPMQQHPPDAR